jgi:hypothetical protein
MSATRTRKTASERQRVSSLLSRLTRLDGMRATIPAKMMSERP